MTKCGRTRELIQVVSVGLVLLVAITVASAQAPPAKKLLEYGWDVPYPDQVLATVRQMEQRPFDGVIFRLRDYNHAFRSWKILNGDVSAITS